MKTASKARTALKPFQDGQVWELENSEVHIGMVGKTLVHYKHYHGKTKRAPISLANKETLEKFLIQNKAVMVQG